MRWTGERRRIERTEPAPTTGSARWRAALMMAVLLAAAPFAGNAGAELHDDDRQGQAERPTGAQAEELSRALGMTPAEVEALGLSPAEMRNLLAGFAEETVVVGSRAEPRSATESAILHRAFSVFVFDEAGRLLLQRRANGKYHSGGLWSNTCCSHPRAGESLLEAAHRRLREEMGLQLPTPVRVRLRLSGRAGRRARGARVRPCRRRSVRGCPRPGRARGGAWKWERVAAIRSQLAEDPGAFTAWFELALEGLLARGLPVVARSGR